MSIRNICAHIIPDAIYIKLIYFKHFGCLPDLKKPKTFNEKLQWLKLYNRKPEYSMMVDKYAVKQFVSEQLGPEYIIPTLGVWNEVDDIDIEQLPEQFVLKWNHDSGSVIICKDKNIFDIERSKIKLKKLKKHNGYNYGREWMVYLK